MKSEHKKLIAQRKERAKNIYEKQQEEVRLLRLKGKKQADDYVRAYKEEAKYYEAEYLEENYRRWIMAKRDELISNGDKDLANSLMSLVFKISTKPYKIAGNKELTEQFANEYGEFKKIANEGSREELADFFFKTFFEGKKVIIYDAEEMIKRLEKFPNGTTTEHNYREIYLLYPDGSKQILGTFTAEEKAKLEMMVLKNRQLLD